MGWSVVVLTATLAALVACVCRAYPMAAVSDGPHERAAARGRPERRATPPAPTAMGTGGPADAPGGAGPSRRGKLRHPSMGAVGSRDPGVRARAVGDLAGHRVLPRAGGCGVEAWGPDRAVCTTEALVGLVESFAEVGDATAARAVPLAASGGAADDLVALAEEVIDWADVFGLVPVRFHLAETEAGGLAGDMEVVPASQVRLVGPVPTRVASRGLSMEAAPAGWRCRMQVEA